MARMSTMMSREGGSPLCLSPPRSPPLFPFLNTPTITPTHLPVDVSANGDRALHWLHVALICQDFFGLGGGGREG